MDNDDWLLGLVGLGVLFCLGMGLYGTYTLGRSVERKQLEPAIKQAFRDTYSDGLSDGQALCTPNK